MEGTSCSKSREQGNLMSLGQGSMRLKLPWLLCFYTDMVLYTGGSFFSLSFICLQLIVGPRENHFGCSQSNSQSKSHRLHQTFPLMRSLFSTVKCVVQAPQLPKRQLLTLRG